MADKYYKVTSTGTDETIYSVTPKRICKVKRIVLANEATSDAVVIFKDDTVEKLGAIVKASDMKVIDLGEGLEFNKSVKVNTTQQPLHVTIIYEEI